MRLINSIKYAMRPINSSKNKLHSGKKLTFIANTNLNPNIAID